MSKREMIVIKNHMFNTQLFVDSSEDEFFYDKVVIYDGGDVNGYGYEEDENQSNNSIASCY